MGNAVLEVVGTTLRGVGTRAEDIEARRVQLGWSVSDLAERASVDRGRLAKFLRGEVAPRPAWIGAVEKALSTVEDGGETTEPHRSGLVRFTVEGVYGAKALVVEGPVGNIPELEAAVDRIMRRVQGETGPADNEGSDQ